MSDLVERINRFLAATPGAKVQASVSLEQCQVAERFKAALSGTFGEAIEVAVGDGADAGAYFALVPARHLKASGVRVVESIAPARAGVNGDRGQVVRVAAGSADAAVNASNRVAKPLGEGWRASVDSFVSERDEVVFRIDQA